ncbi:MAG: hypothetical protein AAGA08_16060 [Pseudomonadota bacterium]
MARQTTSFILILLVCFGLLLPKLGAMLFEIVPGLTQAVICVGSQVVVLTLNEDGEPVDVPEPLVEHCALGDVVASSAAPNPFWVTLARSFQSLFVEITDRGADAYHFARVPLAQAPPHAA